MEIYECKDEQGNITYETATGERLQVEVVQKFVQFLKDIVEDKDGRRARLYTSIDEMEAEMKSWVKRK